MKRQDLADQFELIVKQEIINYNNKVVAVNTALEALKNRVIDLAHDEASNRGDSISRDKALEISINKNREDITSIKYSFDSRINDIISQNYKVSQEVRCDSKRLDDLENWIKDFHKDIAAIKGIVASVRDENEKIVVSIKGELDRHYHKACKNLSQMEDSILSRPSEALEVKKELEKKICEKNVEITGIHEAFDHFTKKYYYIEKQIEDIYNKFSRIKG